MVLESGFGNGFGSLLDLGVEDGVKDEEVGGAISILPTTFEAL